MEIINTIIILEKTGGVIFSGDIDQTPMRGESPVCILEGHTNLKVGTTFSFDPKNEYYREGIFLVIENHIFTYVAQNRTNAFSFECGYDLIKYEQYIVKKL